MYRAITSLVVFLLLHTVVFGDLAIQIVQVCNDAGSDCTELGPGDTNSAAPNEYVYESQVQAIWSQVPSIGALNFSHTTWNNTAGQQLTQTERDNLYDDAWVGGAQPPAAPANSVQIFFVKDHPGTCINNGGMTECYDGTSGTGWEANPLADPASSARNAGNAQLGVTGFSTNGRSVMANNGFATDQLAGTLAHEIGHLLGLRHVNDDAASNLATDPSVSLEDNIANLMWAGGQGPAYVGGMGLVDNFPLSTDQKTAAFLNGTNQGFVTAVPEPSAFLFIGLVSLLAVAKKKCRMR